MHVTGEEKGLLGSKYYSDNPIYPLENTVTNLNIDMIGRIDPTREKKNREYVYIIGSDHDSQDLHNLSEQTNAETINIIDSMIKTTLTDSITEAIIIILRNMESQLYFIFQELMLIIINQQIHLIK